MNILLKDKSFVDGNTDTKRAKVNSMLKKVKKRVNDYLTDVPSSQQGLNYRRKKLDGVDKGLLKRAKEIVNVESSDVRDLTAREIMNLETAIKTLRYYDSK